MMEILFNNQYGNMFNQFSRDYDYYSKILDIFDESNYYYFKNKQKFSVSYILDKDLNDFEVVKVELPKNRYKLVVREKSGNVLNSITVHSMYSYKVFYKEGVLVFRFDKSDNYTSTEKPVDIQV